MSQEEKKKQLAEGAGAEWAGDRNGGEREGRKKAGRQAAEDARAGEQLRLTDRDRQLMGLLATVRYLSMEQIQRLVWAQRSGINLHKRLLALAGEGRHGVKKPYLRRLVYRGWEGMPESAWGLTTLGYTVASSVLPKPPQRPAVEVGAAFMEHGLLLNELYVQLLEAPLKLVLASARERANGDARPSRAFARLKATLYARAAHPKFRWHSHDEVRLPWREYLSVTRTGKQYANRVLVPDATLEVPGSFSRTGAPYFKDGKQQPGKVRTYAGRRYFLECETGSQSIVAESDEKQGATVAKLGRYSDFFYGCVEGASWQEQVRWHGKHFPDNFEPHLLFLVRTPGRMESVNAAIAGWKRKSERDEMRVEALTFERAAAKFLGLLGHDALPAVKPLRTLNSAEYRLMSGFTQAAREFMHLARGRARGRNLPVPEYPAQLEPMEELVARLER